MSAAALATVLEHPEIQPESSVAGPQSGSAATRSRSRGRLLVEVRLLVLDEPT